MAEVEEVEQPTASDLDRMQALLDELKSSQSKEKPSESKDEEEKPFKGKNLKEAGDEAYVRVRAHNRRLRSQAAENPADQ